MRRSEAPFFATQDEQIDWLTNLLADERIWCVVRVLPPKWRIWQVAGTQFLSELELAKKDDIGGLQLFLGRTDLVSGPIWKELPSGDRDIDMPRSQAVQFDPAMVSDGEILLQGEMGIARRFYYDEAGIDPKPIHKWFRELTTSFGEMSAGGTVVLRDPRTGAEREYPDIVATRGAIQWQRSGRLLKQFVNGAYEFVVRNEAKNPL